MDARPLFQSLQALAEDNASFFQRSGTESGRRFAAAFAALREHGRRLEPALRHFARLYHRFDLDEATPGNGYRSLVQTARCCLAHAVHKSRYVAAHRRSVFFRAGHNVAELEAYCAALAQLRALLCLAQRLLAHNRPGCLFPPEEDGLSELVLREYSTMHNGCFYGRCLGFQFAPSIRPFLQTIAIGLVSFGENYKRNDMGLGVAAGSLFTSGKFAIDPELRGDEFERLTQNLDVHFWKSFWNLTETELLASVASMTATQVGVCRALTVPPEPLELPLAADPSVTVTIAPPVAHTGPGPVHMRLLSYQLREGQDSAALSALTRAEGPRAPLRWWRGPPLPPSPALLVHFHGGGFVAQTSRSHEPYLRGWARELGAPILSVDYALAPEAPFPRALEECFYAYCWALRNCRLLGSTAQRVCLAGDSAGGNLCLTVSMRAAAVGVQAPDGIMAAYPVTLVQAAVSPSRLLTLLDPLLPLGVLCKCLSAYAGGGAWGDGGSGGEGGIRRRWGAGGDGGIRRRWGAGGDGGVGGDGRVRGTWGAGGDGGVRGRWGRWGRRGRWEGQGEMGGSGGDGGLGKMGASGGHGGLGEMGGQGDMGGWGRWAFGGDVGGWGEVGAQDGLGGLEGHGGMAAGASWGPPAPPGMEGEAEPPALETLSPTRLLRRDTALLLRDLRRGAAAWLGGLFRGPPAHPDAARKSISEAAGAPREEESSPGCPPGAPHGEGTPEDGGDALEYPDEFQPLRSRGPPACFNLPPAPLARNPYMSPLLAPDGMLGGLPPVHLVACALDPMLDDSVALARRLRALGRPVTLRVVPDLPHGFLSLGPLSPETRQATAICTRLIRDILQPPSAPPDGPRRGSLLLGLRRDSLAPQDGFRRGSVLLGSRRESLAPQDSPRRGSVLLGSRRESLAPQDSPRRGSVLLGSRRESLAPQDSPRRGSLLLGSRRESLAPQDSPRRGSVLLGSRRESLAPQDSPRRGSLLLGARRDSLAPQEGPRHGSLLLGGCEESLATHGVGGTASLGSLAAATHSMGDVGGPGAALTHGSVAAANPGVGVTSTHSDDTTPTHGTGAEGGSAALTHGSGATSTHGHGAALTHVDGTVLPHGTGASSTHSTSTGSTHGNGTALTHGTAGSLPAPETGAPPRRPSAQPPPCCGAPASGGSPRPPDGAGPPRPPPGQRHSGAQPLARRPSGPAGREVGS
ncbi:hypothetical protein QYF61_002896 [Mycteria americana]|uniref:Hormone-sensitive lipase n=4 Tax=Neoaves TaxID=3078114 RepID=A0AAN7MZN7_MYCAM|nr:hypothetical protein QYF61_002896 [Mycteria americana]